MNAYQKTSDIEGCAKDCPTMNTRTWNKFVNKYPGTKLLTHLNTITASLKRVSLNSEPVKRSNALGDVARLPESLYRTGSKVLHQLKLL